jgi:hypothetical protein
MEEVQKKEKQFYSYLWLREKDGFAPAGTPYYAGKGSNGRAFTKSGHAVFPPSSLENIVILPMLNEVEAFESEIAMIELFGRIDNKTGILRNMTDGGDCGPDQTGFHHSEEWKQKLRDVGCAHLNTPEANAKKSATKKGVSFSQAHRNAIGAAHKANTLLMEKLRGRNRTPEARAHSVRAMHNRWHVNRGIKNLECALCQQSQQQECVA